MDQIKEAEERTEKLGEMRRTAKGNWNPCSTSEKVEEDQTINWELIDIFLHKIYNYYKIYTSYITLNYSSHKNI